MAKVTRRSLRKARSVSDSLMQLPTSDYSSGTSETASEKEVEDNLPPPIKLVTVPSFVNHSSSSSEKCVSLSSDIAPSAIPQTMKRLCPLCPYIASSGTLYMKHLNCHDRQLPFTSSSEKTKQTAVRTCPHCSYSTRARGRLVAHMKTHFSFSKYLLNQGIEVSHGMVWEPSDEIAIELMDNGQGTG